MEDLWYRNAKIYICIECVGMDINILDIIHIIQFKISNFIALPELLQQLGWEKRNKSHTAIASLFISLSQILSDNVHMLKQSILKNLQLFISKKNCKQITNIITQLYKNKLELVKIQNVYEKTNPEILWFLNTSKYRQRLILSYFIY